MCQILSLNNAVAAGTLTKALTIKVLLARDAQVTAVLKDAIHCVALQTIFTVSAVVVQSGATVVLAVTFVVPVFIRLD